MREMPGNIVLAVMPAKAGIQKTSKEDRIAFLDSGVRRSDEGLLAACEP
jgi:hypothetical protein